MRKINLFPLFIACILSACLTPSEGDDFPNEPPKLNPTSSLTTVFTATPSQTPTPEPKPTPDPAQIAAEDLADFKLNPADFTQKIGPNGEIQYWDGSTLIYSGGAWNADEIVDIVAKANICKPTEYKVDPSSSGQQAIKIDLFRNYYLNMFKTKIGNSDEFQKVNPGPLINENGVFNYSFGPRAIEGTDQCWLFKIRPFDSNNRNQPANFAMMETNNGVVGFPLFQP